MLDIMFKAWVCATYSPPVDYRIQYRKWIFENNIVISDDNKWIQNLPTVNHRVKPSRKNLVNNIKHVVLSQVVESYHFSPLELQLRSLKSEFIKLSGLTKLGEILSKTPYVLPWLQHKINETNTKIKCYFSVIKYRYTKKLTAQKAGKHAKKKKKFLSHFFMREKCGNNCG